MNLAMTPEEAVRNVRYKYEQGFITLQELARELRIIKEFCEGVNVQTITNLERRGYI